MHRTPNRARLAILLLLGACSWEGYIPGGPPKIPTEPLPTTPLALDAPTLGALDCPAGRCQIRYRVEIRGSGRLRVDVTPHVRDDNLGMKISLQDPVGRVLDQRRAGQDELVLESPVEPGPYDVLVQAIGGAVPFDVVARFTSSPGGQPVSGAPSRPRLADATPTPRPAEGSKADHGSAYDPTIDLGRFRTYDFDVNPEEMLREAPPGANVGNPFLDAQLQRAITAVLLERGLQQVDRARAELIVHSVAGANRSTWYSLYFGMNVDPYAYYFNAWRTMAGGVVTHTFTDGTIVIDFLDPDSNELLWHGWKTDPVPPRADQRQLIQQIVTDILAPFPPPPPATLPDGAPLREPGS
ncbi:MAG: DUF4136 domain-containing protein [Proteobacteria bacterium]|nr:DUF4136 domain-containing protein [Pseudomonadota bacterium]